MIGHFFHVVLVQPLFNLLAVVYALIPYHDFGIAVIIFTVLIRLLLWPLVNRQLHSQRAMQALQPEVAKIREQAKGDRQKESQMLMELYKEREISPFGSIGLLLLQLPIFWALFAVLRDVVKPGEINSLAYSWVKHLGGIKDVLHHGGVINPTFLGHINLAKPALILAITAGLAQYFQTKQLLPKHQSADAQARAMQSTAIVVPVITILVGLTLPSALALYWTVTSLVAIFQQWLLLREDVAELEAAEDKKGGK